MTIPVRPIQLGDVPTACAILNQIIAIGGTTANQIPFDHAGFARAYVTGDDLICCHVALDDVGQVAGFQWLGHHGDLPAGCVDIATFARRAPLLPGVGSALFGTTRQVAKARGFTQINATIRADNRPGLQYYSKMGFVDFAVKAAVPLVDGTPVDRISKRITQ